MYFFSGPDAPVIMSEHGWLGVLEPERGRPWRTRMDWLSKLILSLGALATAFGAIAALLPSPDPEDSARFTSVRVTPQVALTEYQQRVAGDLDSPVVLLAAQVPPASESLELIEETATASPAAESPSPPAPNRVPDVTVTSPLQLGSGILLESSSLSREDVNRATGQIMYSIRICPPDSAECPQGAEAAIDELVSATPDAESPEQAAERVLDMLAEVRTVATASPAAEGFDGTAGPTSGPEVIAEPVGAVVGLDIELVGLRNRSLLLDWSLWRQGGDARLYGQWLETNPAYRLIPSTQRDTASMDLWVPLPKDPGPYFVRLTLRVDGAPLASADSDPME